ncbi:hypothetical protein IWW38_003624 [Coemansia aciculifera]|uniref:Uncharacterized protein n=1 Tax=Coemansia aciculifera TaxID=417176 RepID=A0ACC1M1V9_9FUNG|nr:hypothetical protein IWW38_003624 [Coemansia aciculifera]
MNSCESLYSELFGDDDDKEEEDENDDLKFLDPIYEAEPPVIPGLRIYRNLLSADLSTQYFSWLTHAYFHTPGSTTNQGLHFGTFDKATPLGRLSTISQTLITPSMDFLFDQAIVNLYERGEGIGDHVDLQRFDSCVVGFSFGATAVMRLRPVRDRQTAATAYARELDFADPAEIQVVLRAGDVYILEGEARYGWTHGIPKTVGGGKVNIESRRISVTLRKLVKTD